MAKAKAATLRAIQDGEKGAEEEGALFALPFMARALKKKREEAEAEAKALLEEIERADRRAGEAADDGDDAGEVSAGRRGAESFEPAVEDADADRETPAPATRRTFGGKPTAATRASKRTAAANAAKEANEDGRFDGLRRGAPGLGNFGLDDDVEAGDDVSNRRNDDAPSRNDGAGAKAVLRATNRCAAARAAPRARRAASELAPRGAVPVVASSVKKRESSHRVRRRWP